MQFKSVEFSCYFFFLRARVGWRIRCPTPCVQRAWSWNPERTKQADDHKPDTPHLSGFRVSRAHSDKENLVVLDALFSLALWLPCSQTNQWMLLFSHFINTFHVCGKTLVQNSGLWIKLFSFVLTYIYFFQHNTLTFKHSGSYILLSILGNLVSFFTHINMIKLSFIL